MNNEKKSENNNSENEFFRILLFLIIISAFIYWFFGILNEKLLKRKNIEKYRKKLQDHLIKLYKKRDEFDELFLRVSIVFRCSLFVLWCLINFFYFQYQFNNNQVPSLESFADSNSAFIIIVASIVYLFTGRFISPETAVRFIKKKIEKSINAYLKIDKLNQSIKESENRLKSTEKSQKEINEELIRLGFTK